LGIFRAKEWDDAVKVLGSMFSLDNVVIKEKFADSLSFLLEYNVKFEEVMKMTNDGSGIIKWLVVGFVIVLLFKNSIDKLKTFQPNIINSIIFIFVFTISFYKLSGYSEFLYFIF